MTQTTATKTKTNAAKAPVKKGSPSASKGPANTPSGGSASSNSPMELVALRNRFFYVYYRKISLIFIAALGLCFFSIVCAAFFASRKTPPLYIPVSEDGRIIRTYALNEPSNPNVEIMESTVQQLALDGIRKLYTYDYLNYSNQITDARGYLTVRAWNKFTAKFTASQTLNTVQQQQMIVNFTPLQPPNIDGQKVIEGRLAWALSFPAQIKFVAHNGNKIGFVQTGVMKVIVMRVSTVDSPKGILIDQVVFEEDQKK